MQHSPPVLTSFDDYLVHQTPLPVAHPGTSDPNAYDRYFFNGYAPDGSLFFAAALGLYPNRQVMDASFSVVRNGKQVSVHSSRRAPLDRADSAVPPIEVEVIEPLRQLRVRVNTAGADGAIGADLTFGARTAPIEEPRYIAATQNRTTMDLTRLTQFGTWDGWVDVAGERGEVQGVLGTRDRSWGVRPVGERGGGAPGGEPQFFWLWAPLQFEDRCLHFDVNEDATGRPWHRYGAAVATDGTDPEPFVDVKHEIHWRPGTRRAEAATLRLTSLSGRTETVELEPILDFQMLGLGYLHPEWGHGMWKGEHAVHVEKWTLADLDPLDYRHLHVQQLCHVRSGNENGIGVLEQLVIGRHSPSGFDELLDGAK